MYSTVFTRLNAALDRTSQSHKRSIQSEECGVNSRKISYKSVMYTIQTTTILSLLFFFIVDNKIGRQQFPCVENSDVISTTFKSWLVLEGVSECEYKHDVLFLGLIISRLISLRTFLVPTCRV